MASPAKVLGILVVLISLTLSTYHFFPDALIRTKLKEQKIGKWGTPDAEINWCEEDYYLGDHVAEPFNTVTSLLYIILAAYAFGAHVSLGVPLRLRVLLLVIAAIGAGSTVFHGSLRYKMQLLDELPMYALVLGGLWCLVEKEKDLRFGQTLPLLATVLYFVMCAVTLSTERQDTIHSIMRGFLVVTFALFFILFFYLFSAVTAPDIERRLREMSGERSRLEEEEEKEKQRISSLLGILPTAFYQFVAALVCWLLDNFYCGILSSLPFGIPYPQLHALGWHVLTAVGLYNIFLVLLLQRLLVEDGGGTHTLRRGIFLLPVLVKQAALKQD